MHSANGSKISLMTVHLVKLSVGAESVDDLRAWVKKRVASNKKSGAYCDYGAVHDHVTRMHPRREAALLEGGSIYWVIKGAILARQAILGFEKTTGADEIVRTAIILSPEIVLTQVQPRRAFQGWRYLPVEDAPGDLKGGCKNAPPELSLELAELGLL